MHSERQNYLIYNYKNDNKELAKNLLDQVKLGNWDEFIYIFRHIGADFSASEILDLLRNCQLHNNFASTKISLDSDEEVLGPDCYFSTNRAIELLYRFKKDSLSSNEFRELLINSLINIKGNLILYTDLFIDINLPPRIIKIINLINSEPQRQYWLKEEIAKILDDFWQGQKSKLSYTSTILSSMILSAKRELEYPIPKDKLNKDQRFNLIELAVNLNRLDIVRYLYNESENLLNIEELKSETIKLLKKLWFRGNGNTKNIFIKEFIFSKAKKYLSQKVEKELFFGVKLESLEMQFLVKEMPFFLYKKDYGQKLLDFILQKEKCPEMLRSVKLVRIIGKMVRSQVAPKFVQHLFNTMPRLIEVEWSEILISISRPLPKNISSSLEIIAEEAKLEYIKLLINNNFDVNKTFDNNKREILTKRPLLYYFLKKILEIQHESIFEIMTYEELYEKIKLLVISLKLELDIIKSLSNLIERDGKREVNFSDWINDKLNKFIQDKDKEDSEYEKLRKSLQEHNAELVRETLEDIAPYFIKDIIRTISLIDKRFGLGESMTIIVPKIAGHIISEKFRPRLSEYLSPEKLENIIEGVCIKIYIEQIRINRNITKNINEKKENLVTKVESTESITANNIGIKRNLDHLYRDILR